MPVKVCEGNAFVIVDFCMVGIDHERMIVGSDCILVPPEFIKGDPF